MTELFVPAENAAEAAVAEQLTVYPARSAADVIRHLAGRQSSAPPAAQDTMPPGSGLAPILRMCAARRRPAARWKLPLRVEIGRAHV